MTPAEAAPKGSPGELVALHALSWLVLGTGVGLWMATLLLLPQANRFLAPLGYGRWAPLHLDLTLYGWLALPLVGVLLGHYRVGPGAGARWALSAWSGALVVGSVSWLAGRTSAKPFLDWTGGAAWVFLAAQLLLLAVLVRSYLDRTKWPPAGTDLPARVGRAASGALLALLAAVPVVLMLAESRSSYPPINPESGGPTGASLLGSTLGLVAILLALPRLARLPGSRARRLRALAPVALTAHFGFYLALAGGDRSHAEAGQLAALATLAFWAPALSWDLAGFRWPRGSRRWLLATGAWGALLVATGLLQFLPSILPRVKFTHVLVAHAHLAMAGLASSFVLLALHLTLDGTRSAGRLSDPGGFWLWQGATVLHLAALFAAGACEARDAAFVLRGGELLDSLLALRWLGGGLMAVQAARWWLGVAQGLRSER